MGPAFAVRHPTLGEAHHQIALFFFEVGRVNDAIRHFERAARPLRAMKLDPANPAARENLSRLPGRSKERPRQPISRT